MEKTSSKSVCSIMLKEHDKIKNILEEFEKQNNQNNLFNAREVFEKFKWNLEKHFFIEEKIIFNVYQIESQEDDEDIETLLKDHKDILFLIKNIEESLSKDKILLSEPAELKQIIDAHVIFENESFYPRLDEELTEEQKQMIIERTEEETIK